MKCPSQTGATSNDWIQNSDFSPVDGNRVLFRNVALNKNRKMNYVQNFNHCINMASSRTLRSYFDIAVLMPE
jgi:hypothetical protein